MCDLSHTERDAILAHVSGLEELVTRIRTSARSIEDRNWLDHEGMDDLLGQLAAKTSDAQAWVHHKASMTHG
jgi:hypothetical protein